MLKRFISSSLQTKQTQNFSQKRNYAGVSTQNFSAIHFKTLQRHKESTLRYLTHRAGGMIDDAEIRLE